MKTFRLPCGCIVQNESNNVERVIKMCDCCQAEFSERHQAAVESASHVYRDAHLEQAAK